MTDPIHLVTDGGSGRLVLRAAGGACTGCGRDRQDGQRILLVELDPGDGGPSLCGTCIAEAGAILLGRRHVQHGGRVGDLDRRLLQIAHQVEVDHPDWSPAAHLQEARRRLRAEQASSARPTYIDSGGYGIIPGPRDDVRTGVCANCHQPFSAHLERTYCPREDVA